MKTKDSNPFSPRFLQYGNKVGATYIADYLEYCALLGVTESLSDLYDKFCDENYSMAHFNRVAPGGDKNELHKLDSDRVDFITQTETVLRDRLRRISASYPFEITGKGASLKLSKKTSNVLELSASPYVALLAIALLHEPNAQVVSGLDAATLEDSFEDIVARAFNSCGINAHVFPTYGPPYAEKVEALSARLRLRAEPRLGLESIAAKDGGVDIIAHFPCHDMGNMPYLIMLGQATCGKSDTWAQKARDIPRKTWAKMTRSEWPPFSFLAVPHHVDPHHWPYFAEKGESAIFDRVNLTLMLNNETPPDGTKIARKLLKLD